MEITFTLLAMTEMLHAELLDSCWQRHRAASLPPQIHQLSHLKQSNLLPPSGRISDSPTTETLSGEVVPIPLPHVSETGGRETSCSSRSAAQFALAAGSCLEHHIPGVTKRNGCHGLAVICLCWRRMSSSVSIFWMPTSVLVPAGSE